MASFTSLSKLMDGDRLNARQLSLIIHQSIADIEVFQPIVQTQNCIAFYAHDKDDTKVEKEATVLFTDTFVDYAKKYIRPNTNVLLQGDNVITRSISDQKLILVTISTGAIHPTIIQIQHRSTLITLSSPIHSPSTIIFNSRSQSKISKFDKIEILRNDKICKQVITPIANLVDQSRSTIAGVVVKVSAVNKKNEDKLYQVYIIDESSQSPIRVSVYLQMADNHPYFMYYGTCVIMSNISIFQYDGKLVGKFSSRYSGLVAYLPCSKQIVSNGILIQENSTKECLKRLSEWFYQDDVSRFMTNYLTGLNEMKQEMDNDCVCKVISIQPIMLNFIQSFVLFDDSLVYNAIHTRRLVVDSCTSIPYSNDFAKNPNSLYIKFFNIRANGDDLVFNDYSSFLIIPPDSPHALDLEKCWKYCNSEREKHLSMSSLVAVVNDGIYVIRFSVKKVLSVNKDQFELMITDGTAECNIIVGSSVMDYFDGNQSISDLETIFSDPRACFELPLSFKSTPNGKQVRVASKSQFCIN